MVVLEAILFSFVVRANAESPVVFPAEAVWQVMAAFFVFEIASLVGMFLSLREPGEGA